MYNLDTIHKCKSEVHVHVKVTFWTASISPECSACTRTLCTYKDVQYLPYNNQLVLISYLQAVMGFRRTLVRPDFKNSEWTGFGWVVCRHNSTRSSCPHLKCSEGHLLVSSSFGYLSVLFFAFGLSVILIQTDLQGD